MPTCRRCRRPGAKMSSSICGFENASGRPRSAARTEHVESNQPRGLQAKETLAGERAASQGSYLYPCAHSHAKWLCMRIISTIKSAVTKRRKARPLDVEDRQTTVALAPGSHRRTADKP